MRATCAILVLVVCASLRPAGGAQTLETAGRLTVVDANGKTLGTAAAINAIGDQRPTVTIAFSLSGRFFALEVAKDSFFGADDLWFESTDCSGTPFFETFEISDRGGAPLNLSRAGVAPPGSTVYLPNLEATPRTIAARSSLGHRGTCVSFDFTNDVGPVVPTEPHLDLNSLFTPPFRVIASSSTCGDCDSNGAVTANELTRVILNIFDASPQARAR
jgi:hypothetical protein